MRLGCSSSSYRVAFANGSLDVLEWLRVCGEDLGLDGVEIAEADVSSAMPAELRAIKKRCVDLHLTLNAITVTNDLGPDHTRPQELFKIKHCCEIAVYLGAPIVRIFAGRIPLKRSDGAPGWVVGAFRKVFGEPAPNPRRVWSDVTWTLRQCSDYAADRGVVLALQNDPPGGLVASPAQLAQCVRDVGSPWLRLSVDPAALLQLGGSPSPLPGVVLAQARMHDVREDGSDARTHWPEVLRYLQQAQYRGFVHLDYHGQEDPATAVPRAVSYLRGIVHVLERQQLLESPAAPASDGAHSASEIVREAFSAQGSTRR